MVLSNEEKYDMSLYLIDKLKEHDIYYLFDINSNRICRLEDNGSQTASRHLINLIEKYYYKSNEQNLLN